MGSSNLMKMSNEMLNDAGNQGATAMWNTYDAVSGNNRNIGMKKQPLSQMATNTLFKSYGPPNGSGQPPGSSGYKVPIQNSGNIFPPSTPSYGTISPSSGVVTMAPQMQQPQAMIQPLQQQAVSAAQAQIQADVQNDNQDAMVEAMKDVSKKLDTKED